MGWRENSLNGGGDKDKHGAAFMEFREGSEPTRLKVGIEWDQLWRLHSLSIAKNFFVFLCPQHSQCD